MREIVHRYAGALRGPAGRVRFKSMFGGGQAAPPPPAAVATPTPPPTMPDMMSPSVLEARRKSIADAGSSGRSATILTTATSRGSGGTIASAAGDGKLGGG